MEVEIDVEALQGNAHAHLMAIAAGDPTIEAELGPDATPQQIADYYAHNPETVAAATMWAVISHGLTPVAGLVAVGQTAVQARAL